ncbi:hypothetical protein HMPREF0454_04146 [Hafnia alvei ATCC 51873]|uniref:Uncharacterized protein n=1 Tax=Hafnia alvei ATCC 51873 TaxID=1002364 RepID=G9YC20_HAFAL|nr:hypothetical protein HMPREF0454_04146 [Hafnia alvei ATCC 51873]
MCSNGFRRQRYIFTVKTSVIRLSNAIFTRFYGVFSLFSTEINTQI